MKAALYSKVKTGLNQILGSNPSAALVDTNNKCLALKNSSIADLGTLPQVSWTSHQYLHLHDGDIVLVNDPYSGNSHLHSMTLVMGLSLAKTTKQEDQPADYLLSQKLSFKPRVNICNHLEEEGLRIPPSPIYHQGQLNTHLLDEVVKHPYCPDQFKSRLTYAIEALKAHYELIPTLADLFSINKTNIKNYLKYSQKTFLELLEQWSHDEVNISHRLNDGSHIKLRLETKPDKILFDFSGTETSEQLNLTQGATVGACLGALWKHLPNPTPVNAGCLEQIEITTPNKSMVNCTYPKPTFFGMTDGIGLVAQIASQALQKLIPDSTPEAESSPSLISFEIQFDEDEKVFYDTLPAGLGANNQSAGLAAYNYWHPPSLNPCLEEIESRYPLRIKSIRFREKSGGHGAFSGGQGQARSYELLRPGTLRWSVLEHLSRPQGLAGGKPGAPFEAHIQRGKEKIPLGQSGDIKAMAGDVLYIQSAGGGGYGPDAS